MIDANQVWDVDEAIAAMRGCADSTPGGSRSRRAPTTCSATRASARRSRRSGSPPASTSRTASMFKQLFQAEAIDVCQIDACRLGGVNEVLAVLLLAAKFGVPVCPHAGGVGLCEYVQHLAVFDYMRVSGSLEDRLIEWVDHLHEHFVTRPSSSAGRYRVPPAPGYSIEMLPGSLAEYAYPERPGLDRGARRWTVNVAVVAHEIRGTPATALPATSARGALPAAAGGALRASRRPRADPADPDRRRQPDDAGLPHEPQHRQRLLADRRDRGARARPAARDRQPRHRPLGRLDGRALGRRRRDRLRARPLDGARRSWRSSAPGSRSALANGLVFVVRPRAASVHRHPREPQHRPRPRPLGRARDARSRACPPSSTRSAAGRSAGSRTRPSSSPASRSWRGRADDLTRLGPLALRRRRQSRGAAAPGIPVGRVLVSVYVAQRPRRRRRRPAHRRPASTPARRPPATSPSSTRSPP